MDDNDVADASLLTVSDMNNSPTSDQALDVISQKQPPIFDDLLDAPVVEVPISSSDTSFVTAMSDLGIGASPGGEKIAEDLAAKLDDITEESKSGRVLLI